MVCEMDIKVWIDDDVMMRKVFCFMDMDSEQIVKILEGNGISTDPLQGSDYEFWLDMKKNGEEYLIEGVVYEAIWDDGGVIISNADEWIVDAIVCKILEDVERRSV